MTSFFPEPKPLPDPRKTAPALTAEMLPEHFRHWLMDTSERMSSPLAYVAVPALCAASACVGRGAKIRPKEYDTWREHPLLWGYVVGGPGVLKSPGAKAALEPIRGIEREWADLHLLDEIDHEKDMVAYDAEKKTAHDKLRKAYKSGQQEAISTAREAIPAEPIKPRRRKVVVNDPTCEAYVEDLQANHKGMLCYRDELSGFLRMMSKPGREADRAFWLEAWTGTGSFHQSRIGRGDVSVDGLAAVLFGTVQPGVLAELLTDGAGRGGGADGLCERFQLAVWPDGDDDYRYVDRCPDNAAYELAEAVFRRLVDIKDVDVGFDDDAQQIFIQWLTRHENRIRKMGGIMGSHLAKYRRLVPGLSLLFHLIDSPEASAVSANHLHRAIQWAEFLEVHARKIYGSAPEGVEGTLLHLTDRLTSGDVDDGFTARALKRRHWRGLTDGALVDEALDWLVSMNWLKCEVHETAGRPQQEYHINPAIYEME